MTHALGACENARGPIPCAGACGYVRRATQKKNLIWCGEEEQTKESGEEQKLVSVSMSEVLWFIVCSLAPFGVSVVRFACFLIVFFLFVCIGFAWW